MNNGVEAVCGMSVRFKGEFRLDNHGPYLVLNAARSQSANPPAKTSAWIQIKPGIKTHVHCCHSVEISVEASGADFGARIHFTHKPSALIVLPQNVVSHCHGHQQPQRSRSSFEIQEYANVMALTP